MKFYFKDEEKEEEKKNESSEEDLLKDINPEALEMLSNNK